MTRQPFAQGCWLRRPGPFLRANPTVGPSLRAAAVTPDQHDAARERGCYYRLTGTSLSSLFSTLLAYRL